MTAVEWLIKELNQKIDFIPMNKWDEIRDLIQQALEMEEHQNIKAIDMARKKTHHHVLGEIDEYEIEEIIQSLKQPK